MCCNRLRNRKGIRAIIVIDMMFFLNVVRFIYAFRAYKNMEDKFLTYAKVRLVTFWMQAVWLLLNLGVGIYINVWAGSALNYLYIVGAIVFCTLAIGIDFHYMQCVMFLKNHMERLTDKAAEDEENVKYAYQMDPTAPENIEEAKDNEEFKRR
jgi:hypothetical protein